MSASMAAYVNALIGLGIMVAVLMIVLGGGMRR